MPLDFFGDVPVARPSIRRQMRGTTNYHAGRIAEGAVARHYTNCGARILAERWRGGGGEIDLILQGDQELIFVEVKAAQTHALAAERVTPAKSRRIKRAAESYLAQRFGHLDVDMRFDLALVDGIGRIDVLEAVFFD